MLLSFFYRDVHFNADIPNDDIATIVVANHPNAFIDPFALQVALRRPLVRTIRADWLQHWLVKWVIRLIDAVPLARFQKDNHMKNRRSFNQLHAALTQGKWVVVFPEGISHNRSKLKDFKKGTAHIAAEYMAATSRPVRVLQLAIYYTDKSRLNSDIWVEKAGESIYYPEADRISLLTETSTWQANIQATLPGTMRSTEKLKLNWVNHYLDIISNKQSSLVADPKIWHADTQVTQLHAWLQVSGLDLNVIYRHKTMPTLVLRLVAETVVLISGLPIAVLGLLLNLPAVIVHYLVTRQQSKAEDKWASNTYVIGLPLYPLFWFGLTIWFGPIVGFVACSTAIYSLLYWRNWSSRGKSMFTAFNCLSQPYAQPTILKLANEALLPFYHCKPS